MAKAIALLSGGLDSSLAILAVVKQGIEVNALRFLTPFDAAGADRSSRVKKTDTYILAQRFGFDIEIRHIGEKFFDIVKNPPHGYGKNMNPCIDCRILMLKEAKEIMQKTGADFIVTGEVLGQRPMSQRKDMLYHIDKEAGVTGYVLRPLSAKLLKMTTPEQKGIINREMFYDFRGRSRKPQMALAKEFGLEDYPSPAGGCLLTEPNFSCRFKDLLTYDPSPAGRNIELLKIGRHFRFSPLCKIIVGRDKEENEILESAASNGDCLLKVEGYGSPITLISGDITDEAVLVAASICARYSDAKNVLEAEVTIIKEDKKIKIKIEPARDEIIDDLRIEARKTNKIVTA